MEKKRKKTTCTVSWAIVLISSFFQFSFEILFLWRFLGGSVEGWSGAARVSVSRSALRGRDEPLKEEYKGSLKIGSG